MANSLEFSRHGDPIEGRYDGYGEFLADSLPEDPEATRNDPFWYDGWTITELEAEMRTNGLPLPEQGDMEDAEYEESMRYSLRQIDAAPVLHSSEIEPYDPFVTEIDDDKVTK